MGNKQFGGTEGGVCKRQSNKASSGKEPCEFSACEKESGFCGRPNNELLNKPCRPLKDGNSCKGCAGFYL